MIPLVTASYLLQHNNSKFSCNSQQLRTFQPQHCKHFGLIKVRRETEKEATCNNCKSLFCNLQQQLFCENMQQLGQNHRFLQQLLYTIATIKPLG